MQQLVCAVKGTADGIEDLVRNSGNYRARIWFTDLRYSRYPVAHSRIIASARVLRIEIIKVE